MAENKNTKKSVNNKKTTTTKKTTTKTTPKKKAINNPTTKSTYNKKTTKPGTTKKTTSTKAVQKKQQTKKVAPKKQVETKKTVEKKVQKLTEEQLLEKTLIFDGRQNQNLVEVVEKALETTDTKEYEYVINAKTGEKFYIPESNDWFIAAEGAGFSNRYEYSGSNTLDDVAWHKGNSNGTTHPVKGKMPNEIGLYDMSGNVSEWCYDWDGTVSTGIEFDPYGASSGKSRVFRGGSWETTADCISVSYRSASLPTFSNYILGIRVVRTVTE